MFGNRFFHHFQLPFSCTASMLSRQSTATQCSLPITRYIINSSSSHCTKRHRPVCTFPTRTNNGRISPQCQAATTVLWFITSRTAHPLQTTISLTSTFPQMDSTQTCLFTNSSSNRRMVTIQIWVSAWAAWPTRWAIYAKVFAPCCPMWMFASLLIRTIKVPFIYGSRSKYSNLLMFR